MFLLQLSLFDSEVDISTMGKKERRKLLSFVSRLFLDGWSGIPQVK